MASAASADQTTDTIQVFRKLNAKVESGISIRDYSSALADVKVGLQSLEEDTQALPEILTELKSAFGLYGEVNKLRLLSADYRYGTKFLDQNTELGKSYIQRFPILSKNENEGGAMTVVGLHIDGMLPVLLSAATKHVDTAKQIQIKQQRAEAEAKEEAEAKAKIKQSNAKPASQPNTGKRKQ